MDKQSGKMQWGRAIRVLRTEANLTQEQLAHGIGCGSTYVCHLETGTAVPSIRILSRLSEFLKIDETWPYREAMKSDDKQ